ncbi:MAG: methylenetetrahydrofolate reductase [NAD(P)H] [Solirubrobacteraceae bacterium]
MKIIDHIKNSNKTLFSIEVLPPKKGENINTIFETIDELKEFNPSFIDVTYHREEMTYVDDLEKGKRIKKVRKRPGTVAISAAIQNKFQIDAVPHIICGGFSKDDTEYALIDLHFLGIDNILALQGDSLKNEKSFTPSDGGNFYASDLVNQIVDLNNGKYLDNIDCGLNTDFCIGVSGYPEKHFEAVSLDVDLKYLKQKIDLGAEFIVTQMFFNNQKYFSFVKKCREIGINVPIIPGLKPLGTQSQIDLLPKVFFIDIPQELKKEALLCKNNTMVKQLGVEWCTNQCKELIKENVPVLHFYTMSNSETTKKVAEKLF